MKHIHSRVVFGIAFILSGCSVDDDDQAVVTTVESTVTTPYGGTARPIPGTIQAEDFDDGGEANAYHDTTLGNSFNVYRATDVDVGTCSAAGVSCGYRVGLTYPGEWLKYTVHVTAAGVYTFKARVASTATGKTLRLYVDGVDATGALAVPTTGSWTTWADMQKSGILLAAGSHVLTLALDTGYSDIDYLTFTKNTSPYGGTAAAIPGTVQAENYDVGGEGIAYHDTTAGNMLATYRTDDVDVGACTSSGTSCGTRIGYTDAGEWLRYTVNATAGTYTLKVRVASTATGKTLRVLVDGSDVTGALAVPNTGSWTTWADITKNGIVLTAGSHILTLVLDTGYSDVDYVSFAAATTCGNGSVESGEQCESGTCCNLLTCQWKASGSVCDDGDSSTSNDVCNASGTCSGTSSSATAVTWYGSIRMRALQNWQIGRGKIAAYRFKAEHSGTLTSLRIYRVMAAADSPGTGNYAADLTMSSPYYSKTAGDYGRARIEIRADDGSSNHWPSGTRLGTAYEVAVNVDALRQGDAGWRITLPSPQPTLTAGKIYHVYFSNPHPDEDNHWWGLDGISSVSVDDPVKDLQPSINYYDITNTFAVLTSTKSSSTWTWRNLSYPILEAYYGDGYTQGLGYIETNYQYKMIVGGSAVARETFTVSGGNKQINRAEFRTVGATGSGNMTIRLKKAGVTIATASVALSSIPGYVWNTQAGFGTNITLQNGAAYTLEVSAPSGSTVRLMPTRKGGPYGYTPKTFFHDGWGEWSTDGGSTWKKLQTLSESLSGSAGSGQMDVEFNLRYQ